MNHEKIKKAYEKEVAFKAWLEIKYNEERIKMNHEKIEIALTSLREVVALGDISLVTIEDLFYIQLYINDLQNETIELKSKYSDVNEYLLAKHR